MSDIHEQYEEELFCSKHHIPLVVVERDDDEESFYVCPECEREKGELLGWQ
jgi:hypothetical protein